MGKKLPKILKNNKITLAIFAILLLTRIMFLSPWLEDWDSVQFALALHNYSLVDHQPHPPGYPIYVALGKILNSIISNDNLSFTILSSVLGALTTILFYLLVKNITGRTYLALSSTILFSVTPIHWVLSEVALTNVPGTFFTVLTALLLYKGKESPRFLYAGSLFGGLTLGVRFAEYSIVGALLILVLIYRRSFSAALKSIILFSFGLLLWLVPLIINTGWSNFLSAYANQASYIITHDSLVQYTSILDRLVRIWELFLMGYSIYFIAILLLIIWQLRKIKSYATIQPFNYLFVSIWFLSYLIPLVFIYNLEVPRHLLPLLSPLVLLSTLSINKILTNHFALMIYIIIVVAIFFTSLGMVKKQKAIVPPTIAPVLYVKGNFSPEETILVTTFTYRQFQYYAPEFRKNYYGSKNLPDLGTKYAIIDFKNNLAAPELKEHFLKEEVEFSGPREIFPRVNSVKLYVLEKQK